MGFLGTKSRDAVWDEVAAATGGVVIGRGEFWNGGPRVEAPVAGGPWTVVLDTYIVPVMVGNVMVPISFGRACALFLARGDLRLSVSRANPFTGVGKLFGMQDIEVGDAAFDKSFVIQSSDAEQTLRLLGGEPGATLREMLTDLPNTSFGVADDGRAANKGGAVPEGTDVVYAVRSATGGAELVALYGLVAETLRGLHRIGSASDEPVSHPMNRFPIRLMNGDPVCPSPPCPLSLGRERGRTKYSGANVRTLPVSGASLLRGMNSPPRCLRQPSLRDGVCDSI